MSFRNLTSKFVELRDQYSHTHLKPIPFDSNATAHQKLLDNQPIHSLPPPWVDIVDAINADIATIQKSLVELSKVHTERLKVSFSDSDAQEEAIINELTAEITRMLRQSESRIKSIAITKGSSNQTSSVSDRVLRLNVMRAIGVRVQELSKQFRQMQNSFLSKLKSQNKSELNDIAVDREISHFDVDYSSSHDDVTVQVLKSRESEIVSIVKNINELQSIFSEVSVLVVEQGSILDRIDYNIEQSLINIRSGNKDIVKAEEYQKSTR